MENFPIIGVLWNGNNANSFSEPRELQLGEISYLAEMEKMLQHMKTKRYRRIFMMKGKHIVENKYLFLNVQNL